MKRRLMVLDYSIEEGLTKEEGRECILGITLPNGKHYITRSGDYCRLTRGPGDIILPECVWEHSETKGRKSYFERVTDMDKRIEVERAFALEDVNRGD